MERLKPPTTYAEQIQKLKDRGCVIQDDAACERILRQINYYRLTAYILPFRLSDGTYQKGTTIERVYRIYEFDRKLRSLILSVIEEIELYLRTQLSYCHAHTYGAIGYMDPENFNEAHDSEKFTALWQKAVEDNESALFVKHHQKKYDGVFPIWVLIELFSFGMLSHFYGDLKRADRRTIANKCFGVQEKEMLSWLRCCTDLRNICAHYGRLYFRIFSAVPANSSKETHQMDRRLFSNVLMLKHLYQDVDKWNTSFMVALSALIDEYSADICLSHIGFPEDWETILMK